MKSYAKKINESTDIFSTLVSFIILAVLVVFILISPVETTNALQTARVALVDFFGAFILLLVNVCLAFNIYIAFSKYGNIKMGQEKPKYGMFSWTAMVFCAAMGTSILYWSAIEWVYYVMSPPLGLEPFSVAASEISVSYSFFHWGISAWSVYVVGVIPLMYNHYVRKKDDLSLKVICRGLFNDKKTRLSDATEKIVNVIFIFGILGGLTISYGTGIPMLANNLANVFGISEGLVVNIILILIITLIFSVSTYIGLERGMQRLSRITMYASLALIVLFLILGNTKFIVENSVQSMGIMADKFAIMSTTLDTIGGGTFPQDWTCFYWAWWIGLAPWMWVFIAKISGGRSLKAVILTVIIAGSVGSWVFFGAISNYGLGAYLGGSLDVFQIMGNAGANQTISDIVLSLPAGTIILLVWFITGFFLLVTTMDSASYTLAAATTKGLKLNANPSSNLRLFWAIMLTITPLCLLYAGQFIEGGVPLGGLQAMLIITALPVSVIIIAAMYLGYKWLRQDFGHMSREQIAEHFKQENPADVTQEA